jgi:phosphoribosylcarboxyaminoimidazole (NCAIR) mutase
MQAPSSKLQLKSLGHVVSDALHSGTQMPGGVPLAAQHL